MRFQTRLGRGLRSSNASTPPVIPALEGRAGNAELLQSTPCRQVRVIDQPDDLQLLGCGVDVESDAGEEIVQRALILFYAGISDESDLRQALRRPGT